MAAKFAGILDTIQLMPHGFNTQVGSKGASLSGGQCQRLALARAFLRDPPVLVLDECTSALDYQSRQAVMENIRSWRNGKTTIIITHDISQILPRDMVYVVKDGQVVDHGKRLYLEAKPNSPFRGFLRSSMGSPAYAEPPNLNKALPPLPSPGSGQDDTSNPCLDFLWEEPDEHLDDPLWDYLRRFRDDEPQRYSFVSPALPSQSNVAPFRQSMLLGQPGLLNLAGLSVVRTPNPQPSASEIECQAFPSAQRDFDWFDPELPELLGPAFLPTSSEVFQQSAPIRQDVTLMVQSPHGSVRQSILRRTINEVGVGAIPLQPLNDVTYRNMNGVVEAEQPKKQKTLSLWRILSTVWPSFTWKLRWQLLLAILGATVYAVATPMFGFIFSKLLITLYEPVGRSLRAMILSLLVLVIALVDGVCVFVQQSCFERCGLAWVNCIRSDAYRRVLLQPREFFDREENSVSQLMDHFDAHGEQMQALLGRFIGYLFIASAMIVTCIIWSLTSCWKLTLLILACVPIVIGLSSLFVRISNVYDRHIANRCELAASIFMECFANIKTVRALGIENRIETKYLAATSRVFTSGLWKAFICGSIYGASQACMLAIIALTFYFALRLLSYREFALSRIFEVLSILLWTLPNASNIFAFIPQGSTAQEAATRLLRLVRQPLNSFEMNGNILIDKVGAVTFSSVNFSYPTRPTQLVLRNLSLSIDVGQCVAIVGSSGSGKSTIASLLLKLYSTGQSSFSPAGAVYLNGKDIAEIHTPTLRSLVSIVPQIPSLFPATVRENIVYGLPQGSKLARADNVHKAAVAAGIEDFILSLPQGYETLIGEGGIGVSGGQAQRIAIARALVRQPHVLILDEATSALDVDSADKIRQTIISLLRANRRSSASFVDVPLDRGSHQPSPLTVIIITHSREMMNFADKVVMLHEGRIVEEGPYDELLRGHNGPFSRMMRGGERAKETAILKRRSWAAMNNSPGIIGSRMTPPSGSRGQYTGKGKQVVRDV